MSVEYQAVTVHFRDTHTKITIPNVMFLDVRSDSYHQIALNPTYTNAVKGDAHGIEIWVDTASDITLKARNNLRGIYDVDVHGRRLED